MDPIQQDRASSGVSTHNANQKQVCIRNLVATSKLAKSKYKTTDFNSN